MKPPNPGGLDIAGESETAFETSAGEDKDAQLDLSKLPEAPVAKPPKRRSPSRPLPSESRATAKPRLSRSRRPARAAASIQLGAFANQAQAERAWTALSARFPAIGSMGKLIVPVPGRHSASRDRCVAGRRQAGLPGAEGRRRELLRRQ